MSAIRHDPDVNAEPFALEPQESDRPDGASAARRAGAAVAEGERVQ